MKTKLLLIISLMLLGYNLSLAQPGSLDLSFDPGTGADDHVWTTSIQSDGKIIIGGDFYSYNGTTRMRIARLNTDGSLDTSFDPGIGPDRYIYTTSIQSDGKIIIGGGFNYYNGTERNYIARLNVDGSLDTSFNPGTGANELVRTTSIQSDGKIIIGGHFTSFNGMVRFYIARLNADGSLDTSFNPPGGAGYWVRTSSIQSDGKIIIGGAFITFSGIGRMRIARLNTDGNLDYSFDPGTGANGIVETSSIQSDGKIIIGGAFTTYNGTARNYIARLKADGSLDTSFDPGTGANGVVETSSIQSDGKIIIGGAFTSYNGTARNHIARLNTDGSLDTSFDPGTGTGTNSIVHTTSIQSDGKIIIGGFFTSYNGTARNNIARLVVCDTIAHLGFTYVESALTVSFYDTTSGSTAWYWDFGDGNTNTTKNPTHTYTMAGTYYVCLTISNIYICNSESICENVIVTTTTGIHQLVNEIKNVNIFPNPFSNTTTLHTEAGWENAALTLYNSFGQSVKQIKNISGHTIILNRDNLPGGLYFIRLSQDNQIIMTDKLVITD